MFFWFHNRVCSPFVFSFLLSSYLLWLSLSPSLPPSSPLLHSLLFAASEVDQSVSRQLCAGHIISLRLFFFGKRALQTLRGESDGQIQSGRNTEETDNNMLLSFKEGINTSAKHLVVGSYHRIVATLQLLLFSDYDSVVLYRNY